VYIIVEDPEAEARRGRSSAEGARVDALKAPRRLDEGKGSPSLLWERCGDGACPLCRNFLDFSVENDAFWYILGAIFADCSNLKLSVNVKSC